MLKRSYVRTCIALICIILIILLTMVFLEQYPVIEFILTCVAVVLFLCVTIIRCAFLRCLHCGKTLAPLRLLKGETVYCPKCGKPFVYDK